MRIKALHIAILMIISPIVGGVCAQETVWVSTPLELAIDARSSALGGKIVADTKPYGHAASYNPSLVDSSSNGVIHVSYLNYFAGVNVGAVDAVIFNKKKVTLHTGVRFATYGNFSGFDASGWPTEDFTGGDYYAQTGITFRLDTSVTLGVTAWGGFRNLARENAGVLGLDFGIVKRWKSKHFAVGVLASSIGRQFAGTGSQPVGWTPMNLQLGLTKGFNHAPFQIYLKYQHLEKWGLAPIGTYADGSDPLTGAVIANGKWEFGDQLSRHITGGVEMKFGENFSAQIGYDHRRRLEMVAAGRKGTNGISIGMGMKFGDLDVSLARNTYHFAGSSTIISLGINLPG
jgi:hypothetical protein